MEQGCNYKNTKGRIQQLGTKFNQHQQVLVKVICYSNQYKNKYDVILNELK